MVSKEMLENALKRVNALAGTNGRLYNDNTGWFLRRFPQGCGLFNEDSKSRSEMYEYLRGIEDAMLFIKKRSEEIAEIIKESRI